MCLKNGTKCSLLIRSDYKYCITFCHTTTLILLSLAQTALLRSFLDIFRLQIATVELFKLHPHPNKRRSLVRTIRKRQATFLGHVMRRGKLEHLVTTGKFEGKRSRGRQREKIMDGMATWLGTGKVLDTLTTVKDRDLWRDMIANAYKQGT
ncbi:UDP-glucuronosyltransferase 2a1-like [Plakobranchus ocellatus]|uniref:UDP-glucuronosyltransferase 2a1-like n=1 Tax=Plakobranchus ocellatus TaxID=259542 RepID=A0AAV3ZX53_9GAST|nr:UDP-glucuronosyltransferase 2a1-like [Plakobranchus ocellatus]